MKTVQKIVEKSAHYLAETVEIRHLLNHWFGRKENLPAPCVDDGFFVKPANEETRIKICYSDIVWIEAENNYSHIHLASGNYMSVAHNIQNLEDHLPPDIFVRINRSEVVNIYRVYKYSGNLLHVTGTNVGLSVSRSNRDRVFSRFRELSK